jgi:hypothetical protein
MNTLAHTIAARFALLTLVLLPLACSSNGTQIPVFPVRGEVFVGGKPADGAVVHLHPRDPLKCPPAYATVKSDGSFKATTYRDDDGAAPGDYVVTVVWRPERKDENEIIVGPDRLRDRYSQPGKSALKATVSAGENVLPRFDLK